MKFSRKNINLLISLGIITALILTGFFYKYHPKEDTLNIMCEKGESAERLATLAKDFTAQTNISVNIAPIEPENFYNYFFEKVLEEDHNIDIVIGNPEWIGRGVQENTYVNLTTFVKDKNLLESMLPSCIHGYTEYPKIQKQYWAIPFQPDTLGFAYRKDFFEDEENKSIFFEKYGYELTPPKTWIELKDIAEFFYQPDNNLYGISLSHNDLKLNKTHEFMDLLFSWGEDLGNELYEVEGIINSERAIEALSLLKEIHSFKYPTDNYNKNEVEAFMEKDIAMVISFMDLFPTLNNPNSNPIFEKTGYFPSPAGPTGGTYTVWGGQEISILTSAKHPKAAKTFLSWFIKDKTQKKWSELGGMSCNKEIITSPEFHTQTPFNSIRANSLIAMNGFWKVPIYKMLLASTQKYINEYITENIHTPEEALDNIAREWSSLFEEKESWNVKSSNISRENRGKIIYIGSTNIHEFWRIISNRMKREANKRSIKLIDLSIQNINANDENSLNELQKTIHKLVTEEEIDGVITIALDNEKIEKEFEFINSLGIPIVMIDSTNDDGYVLSSIQADNYEGGKMMGEYALEKTKGKGTALILPGERKYIHSKLRSDGAEDVFNAANVPTIIRDTNWSAKTAAQITREELSKPDNNITAIIAGNDPIAGGAYEVLEELNLVNDIVLTGFDGLQFLLKLIQEGKVDATYMQPFTEFPSESIETILKSKTGRLITRKKIIPGRVITKENVHLYIE